MKAIILAASPGKKLKPFTDEIPKTLVSIGSIPLLKRLINLLHEVGIKEVGIVVNYKKEKIRDFIKKENIEGITLIEQPELLGTANAVKCCRDFVKDDDFIVLMGDNLYSANDLRRLILAPDHGVLIAESDNPSAYGVIRHDNGLLVSIDEKPENPASSEINTGAYKFNQKIFNAIETIGGQGSLTVAINHLAKQEPVRVHKIKDYWFDIDSIDDMLRIEGFFLDQEE